MAEKRYTPTLTPTDYQFSPTEKKTKQKKLVKGKTSSLSINKEDLSKKKNIQKTPVMRQ